MVDACAAKVQAAAELGREEELAPALVGHTRTPFLCLITPLCSYLYGGLYGGCMREHV